MSTSNDKVKTAQLLLLLIRRKKIARPKKKLWVKELFNLRTQQGFYHNLVQEMRLNDTESYYNYHRMYPEDFDELHSKVMRLLSKQNIVRPSIEAGLILSATLRYLASGDSHVSLQYAYRVSASFLCNAIPDACKAIHQVLRDEHLAAPSLADWEASMKGYHETWNFANCFASMDGKHIVMQCPNKSGSTFFNYKGTFSLILLALLSPDYLFLCYDLGAPGRESDGGVFERSNFGQAFLEGKLSLPPPRPLPGTNDVMPCVIVADEAFALLPNLMRPFPGRGVCDKLSLEEDHFNQRLSRARRVSENVFGIFASRFRLFRKPILGSPDKIENYTKASIALHNWLQKKGMAKKRGRNYHPTSAREREEGGLENLQQGAFGSNVTGEAVRRRFVEFFQQEGRLHFTLPAQ